MNFFKLCIYFTVFSFIGWVSETIICSYNAKKFVKRGFLNGPFIPVYGFGGLIVVIMLAPFKENPVLLYIVAVVSVTVLEYITAMIMETVFNLKLWDYSKHKYQIKGRVWLGSSLFFGVLGLFGVYIVNPPLTKFMDSLSDKTIKMLGIIIIIYFLLDTISSVITVLNINIKIKTISEHIEEFEEYIANRAEAKQNAKLEKASKTSLFERRLIRAYPNMKSKKHDRPLSSLREYLKKVKEEEKSRKQQRKVDKKQNKINTELNK